MISYLKARPRFFYYLNFWIFIVFGLSTASGAIWCGLQLTENIKNNFVAGSVELGLPRYYGSCAGLVSLTYDALQQNHDLLAHLNENQNQNKQIYRLKVISVIANTFTYSSACTDSNALGLMLTSDANITLDAAFNQIVTFKEAVPLARSYYHEAYVLGYYNTHKLQGFLLEERIQRNAFRATIKVAF